MRNFKDFHNDLNEYFSMDRDIFVPLQELQEYYTGVPRKEFVTSAEGIENLYINFILLSPKILKTYNTDDDSIVLWNYLLDVIEMVYENDEYGLPNFSIIGNQFVEEYTDNLYSNYHMTYRKNTKTFEISEGHG